MSPHLEKFAGATDLKILMCASTFPRWQNDSEAPFVFALAKALQSRGHYVIVLAPHAQGAKQREVLEGVEVRRFQYFWPARKQVLCYGAGMLPNFRKRLLAKLQAPLFFIAEYSALKQAIKNIKPDIIHAHWLIPQGIVAAMLRRTVKLPVVITAHGSDVFSFRNGIGRHLVSYASKHADLVTVNSQPTRIAFEQAHGLQAQTIPMGVNLDDFANPQERDVSEGPVLLAVGRLIDWKGINFTIQALPYILKRLPGAKLRIVGSGPEEAKLRRQVAELGLEVNVEFLGSVPHGEMSSVFSASDVFVSSSIEAADGGTEGLGVVILEALATGIPVVATNAGGITDIITDRQTGILVRQRDSKEIANAVLDVLQDKHLRQQLVRQGQLLIKEKFTWDNIAGQFEDSFNKLLSSTRHNKGDIAFIYPRFTGPFGGERHVLKLAEQLASNGFGVTVYTTEVDNRAISSVPSTVTIRQVGGGFGGHHARTLLSYLMMPALALRIKRTHSAVVGMGWQTAFALNTLLIMRLFKPKQVFYYCLEPPRFAYDLEQDFVASANPFKRLSASVLVKIIRWVDSTSVSGIEHFLANSDWSAQEMKHIYGKKSVVVYPGIELQRFAGVTRHKARENLGLDKDAVIFLTVGKLHIRKRLARSIAVYQGHRTAKTKYYIIGDGPDHRAVADAAAGDPSIVLLGRIPDNKVALFMRAANYFIFTAENEPYGIAPLEAVTAGCQIIPEPIKYQPLAWHETAEKFIRVLRNPNV